MLNKSLRVQLVTFAVCLFGRYYVCPSSNRAMRSSSRMAGSISSMICFSKRVDGVLLMTCSGLLFDVELAPVKSRSLR